MATNTHKPPAALTGLKVNTRMTVRLLSSFPRLGLARRGLVAYAVLGESASEPSERRKETRRPTRLHSGKLIDMNDRFLAECVIRDWAGQGVRLKLAGSVPPPRKFQLYDDRSGSLFPAEIIWRRGAEVGCKLAPASIAIDAKLLRRLERRCYAVR